MPTRVAVDDDEQQIQDLIKEMRRLRSRLATTAVKGTHDEFTAAATPATTYTLTYIPLTGTCLMALNGHVQREGIDYTCDYTTGIVTVSATQAASDKITFRYLVTDWLIARSLIPDIGSFSDNFNRANASTLGSPWVPWASGDSPYNTAVPGIISNQAYLTAVVVDSGPTIQEGGAYIETGSPDGQIDIDLPVVPSLAFLAMFRLNPGTGTSLDRSYFGVAANRLWWVGAGSGGTSLATFSTGFSNGDHLTVILAGSSITVQRNSSTVGTYSRTDNLAATKHGLVTDSASTRWDNFAWVGA